MQAEALKKLSEAAAVQAEALMRIAVMLENRNHQDLLPIWSEFDHLLWKVTEE